MKATLKPPAFSRVYDVIRHAEPYFSYSCAWFSEENEEPRKRFDLKKETKNGQTQRFLQQFKEKSDTRPLHMKIHKKYTVHAHVEHAVYVYENMEVIFKRVLYSFKV